MILLIALARLALEGWWAARSGQGRDPTGERELRWIFLVLVVLFFDLSLGPRIRYEGRELGPGLYARLYPFLLPLHAMRVSTRFGIIVVLAVAFLAGVGIKWLTARLPGMTARVALAGGLTTLLLVEYASFPLPYDVLDWSRRPPVYGILAGEPDDVAVLEWPLGWEDWDDYYTLMSISHWKRLVNGASGFLPRLNSDISAVFSEPDRPERPFPSPAVRRYLFSIHPLRYVVIHNGILSADEQRKWQRLKETSWARYKGRFGGDDLYEIVPLPERGLKAERWVSYDFLRNQPVLQLTLRPLATPEGLDQWVDVLFNEQPIQRLQLHGEITARLTLSRPYHFSAPNVIALRYAYRRPQSASDPHYRIGTTGVVSPGDLQVVSASQPNGSVSSIVLNGIELSPERRGYNLVVLSPEGQVMRAVSFDTFRVVRAADDLVAFIASLPRDTIVAGAVQDEASGGLTHEAVAALRTLGVAGDLRGHFRESHAFIGVKGAKPGSAVEALGPRAVEIVAGRSQAGLGFELTEFRLTARSRAASGEEH